MSTATLVMVVLVCLGCALGLAGLITMGFQAVLFLKAARETGASSRAHLQEVMGRAERLAPRFRELEKKQKAVAEAIARLSATAGRSGGSDS
jgi:hypothetical protein